MNLLGLKNAENERASAARNTTKRKDATLKKTRILSPRLILLGICSVGIIAAPALHAQTLKKEEQAKVDKLNERLKKSTGEEAKAQAALNEYKVFYVSGKVSAGDNASARIYGTATPYGSQVGPGSINEKNLLYIKSPMDSEYVGDNYRGYCTFLGVINGLNTYLPVAVQPGYIEASNSLNKWEGISESIRAEIKAVYLPYRKQIKDKEAAKQAQNTAKADEQQKLAAQRQNRENAQAQAEQAEQNRINQAKEQLSQAKRDVEQAKITQAAKQDADAEVARIQAETEKLKAERARIDAETQKQAQEAANVQAQQLEKTEAMDQLAIDKLKNTVSIVPGKQLGKISLGMTELQVRQLIGAPDQVTQLNKVGPRAEIDYRHASAFTPSRIRRDRYRLDAVSGMEINYEGSPLELKYLSWERGIDEVKFGDLKETFVFDIFYINGKVVQLESDSPQFFTADKKNLQSVIEYSEFPTTVDSVDHLITTKYDIQLREVALKELDESARYRDELGYRQTVFGSLYLINLKDGISMCYEGASIIQGKVAPITQPFPRSRLKWVISRPNTTPYTGDYHLGLSLFNNKGGVLNAKNSDADNVEERMYPFPMNENPVSQAANQVVKSQKESLKQKAKRKLGDFLP